MVFLLVGSWSLLGLVAFARAVGSALGCGVSSRVVKVCLFFVLLSLVVSGCCLLLSFRGGSVRFSFLLGLGLVYSLVVGLAFWK